MSNCNVHPKRRVARGKECVSCANERRIAEDSARKEKPVAEEAERKALEKNNNFMSQKGRNVSREPVVQASLRLSEGTQLLHLCK